MYNILNYNIVYCIIYPIEQYFFSIEIIDNNVIYWRIKIIFYYIRNYNISFNLPAILYNIMLLYEFYGNFNE